MTKFAIIQCHQVNPRIEYVYEAATPDFTMFGGRWGKSNLCEHIELSPAALADEDVKANQLEVREMEIQVGTTRVPDGDPEPAFDDEGNPILDENGDPEMVQNYIDQPVMEMQKRAALISE